jgi:hypothetical protein
MLHSDEYADHLVGSALGARTYPASICLVESRAAEFQLFA